MIPVWSFLFPLFGIVAGILLFGRPRSVGEPSHDFGDLREPVGRGRVEPRPLVIIIPARNEEVSIGGVLGDLVATGDTSHVRIVVVDDHSTDATAAIAVSHAGVDVISSPPLPSGWRGKNWACHTGVGWVRQHVGDQVDLVFLDADVRLALGALDAVLTNRERLGGVVSVQPYHDAPTLVEQGSSIFNVVSMMGIGAGTLHPTAMFGPLVACRFEDYERAGGHEGVRGAVAEDVALAQRFLEAGTPVRVFRGGELIRFRMYPWGARQMIEGWTKNLATGSTSIPVWRSVGVALWVAAMGSSAGALTNLVDGSAPQRLMIVSTYLAAGLTLWGYLRKVGNFSRWTAALFPVPLALFMGLFVRSMWRTYVRQSVTWRGREIDLREGVQAQPDRSLGSTR